jgi:hypothetical protein
MHGPRRILLPGAVTSFKQEWRVRKFPAPPKPSERESIALEMLPPSTRMEAALQIPLSR